MVRPTDKTANNRTPRELNRALVLDLVQEHGPISRTNLARLSGLTKPTVSAIIEELLESGSVRDVGSESRGGRPARLLEFNDDSAAFLGIEIGVEQTAVAVADARGRMRARLEQPAVLRDPHRTVRDVVELLPKVLQLAGVPRKRLRGACAILPGLIERPSGVCVLAPNLGWERFPLRAELSRALRMQVPVYNLPQAAAVAEGELGAARGHASYVWIYVGLGVGAGLVVDGRLFFGMQGYSGEIGHCRVANDGPPCGCGRRGCLETFTSVMALRRAAEAASARSSALAALPRPHAVSAIASAALAGDEAARAIFHEAGAQLARGIGVLLNLLNPQLVVLGGEAIAAPDILLAGVREELPRHAVRAGEVPVVASPLGSEAGLLGAVLLAREGAVRSLRLVPDGVLQDSAP
ncbi:ROK family transcriptional regulator [Sorangium sp. So ce119]|uniref:ROK family transcriptional regulator n=1 Tax=Sorangium sp. So ce119 TaxID=3133279 RepID=UPI003F63863A